MQLYYNTLSLNELNFTLVYKVFNGEKSFACKMSTNGLYARTCAIVTVCHITVVNGKLHMNT